MCALLALQLQGCATWVDVQKFRYLPPETLILMLAQQMPIAALARIVGVGSARHAHSVLCLVHASSVQSALIAARRRAQNGNAAIV